MANATKYIDVLIDSLTKFPGIGRKGAERIAYFIVKSEKSLGKNLINALKEVDEKLDICPDTGMVLLKGEESPLSSDSRNSEILCVVENMEDVIKIENTNSFDGLYHVLGGKISPVDGIGPNQLNIDSLIDRVESEEINEIIFALSATMEGDTTNYYIFRKINKDGIRFSTIARGVSIGDNLEYTDEITLGRSIIKRIPFEQSSS